MARKASSCEVGRKGREAAWALGGCLLLLLLLLLLVVVLVLLREGEVDDEAISLTGKEKFVLRVR